MSGRNPHELAAKCSCPEASLLREWLTDPWSPPSAEQWPVVVLLADLLTAARIRTASHDVAGAADWRRVADRPSDAQLRRRRAEPGTLAEQWRQRHGGEHHGGAVAWSTPAEAVAA